MKKYFLLKCQNSGNTVIAECFGQDMTLRNAIEILRVSSPVTLNNSGYVKIGDVTYTVGEHYSFGA